MRQHSLFLAALLMFACRPSYAAEKYFQGFRFEASVLSAYPCAEERAYDSGSLIRVREGQEYSIVVRNPLPVRVAAAVTVDGLNSIDGSRTTPSESQKWIIEPYSSITISGWQTNDSHSRKFFFTGDKNSYSNWKGKRDGRDYTPNLGLIGVAYFWNSSELRAAMQPPQPFTDYMGSELYSRKAAPQAGASADAFRERDRAGTGMGRNQWNPVTRVNFYYDTGMYSPQDALTIRYEFGTPYPQPLPFEQPRFEYRYPGNFAPEM